MNVHLLCALTTVVVIAGSGEGPGTSIFTSPMLADGISHIVSQTTSFALATEEAEETKAVAVGGHWPQWRGPRRDNVSSETGLMQEWPEGGPPLVWKVEGIGKGEPSLAVAAGRLFTLGFVGDSEYAVALDEATGKGLWQVRVGPSVQQEIGMRWVSQRTPTIDGERLYALTVEGELVCLRTTDGAELWRKNYRTDFGGVRGHFGYCDFPLVDGERLIGTPGGKDAAMVALNKATGEAIWKCGLEKAAPAAYSAVVVAEIHGVRQYINILDNQAIGVAAQDGKLLWQCGGIESGAGNVHAAVVHDNVVLCPTSPAGKLIKLNATADGFVVAEEVRLWGPFQTWLSSTVSLDDRLYAYSTGVLTCIHPRTGDALWRTRVRGADGSRAAVIAADGQLYVRLEGGKMLLLDLTTEGVELKGEIAGPRQTANPAWCFPVIAGRRLLLRDQDELYCYDICRTSLDKPRDKPLTIVLPPPPAPAKDREGQRSLRSVFVPTPQDVVEKMLDLASVKKSDVVVDLGSGDGRIVITAAKKYGCRAIGYEIDKELVESSRGKAEAAGVKQLVNIEPKDLFTADLRDADVVAVYLLPKQLEKLLPQLEALQPGTRIVSHQFEIPGIKPGQAITFESREDGDQHTIYLWKTPLTKVQPLQR